MLNFDYMIGLITQLYLTVYSVSVSYIQLARKLYAYSQNRDENTVFIVWVHTRIIISFSMNFYAYMLGINPYLCQFIVVLLNALYKQDPR